jgi:hypothetical protein
LQQRAELALALLYSFPDLQGHLRSQIPDLRLVGHTPLLDSYLPVLEERPAEGDWDAYLSKRLNEEQHKELLLQLEDRLRVYDDTDIDAVRALEELMVILQRVRSDAKEEQKASLAQAINQAQAAGDQARLLQLFSELKNLL